MHCSGAELETLVGLKTTFFFYKTFFAVLSFICRSSSHWKNGLSICCEVVAWILVLSNWVSMFSLNAMRIRMLLLFSIKPRLQITTQSLSLQIYYFLFLSEIPTTILDYIRDICSRLYREPQLLDASGSDYVCIKKRPSKQKWSIDRWKCYFSDHIDLLGFMK